MKKETLQPVLVIASGLVALGVIFYVYELFVTENELLKESKNILRFDPPTFSMNNGDLRPVRLFYDPDGKGGVPEKDITKEAIWFAHSPDIVFVSNEVGMKGEVLARNPGEGQITASYNDAIISAVITVADALLGVTCEASKLSARVGETVAFVALFNPIGVPDYRYIWSGTDGISGTAPILFQKYTKPGAKLVLLTATDQAGSTADTTCSVEIVQ
jgi:hypothetical protein